MPRLLLLLSALVACTPSPRKAAMPTPDPMTADTVPVPDAAASPAPTAPMHAARGPIPEAVSAAGIAAHAMAPAPPPPVSPADSSAAALGRRTLSTAFVRIGPDGYLSVERHDGHLLVLRDVTMGLGKYCGVEASGARYCGGYAEVASARPGGAPPA